MRITASLVLGLAIVCFLFIHHQPLAQSQKLKDERERHLTNIRQLTFDGENAEAYFSPDGSHLIFQRAAKGDGCDQIFSFLPRPGISYTLVARFGVSGITYDPLQFTF